MPDLTFVIRQIYHDIVGQHASGHQQKGADCRYFRDWHSAYSALVSRCVPRTAMVEVGVSIEMLFGDSLPVRPEIYSSVPCSNCTTNPYRLSAGLNANCDTATRLPGPIAI